MNLAQWTPTRIPISHQLPPMPHAGCPQIPVETESGWQAMPKVGELQPVQRSRPMPQWLKEYFHGNEKTGYTLSAPWMRHFEPLKTPKCPQCPNDKNVDTTIGRLAGNIKANLDRMEKGRPEKHKSCNSYIGSRIEGYECIATDGYRAILVLKPEEEGKTPVKWPICEVPAPSADCISFSDPNIFLAIKRLATLSKEDKISAITFNWDHEFGELTVSSNNSSHEVGIERFPCEGTFSGNVKLDPDFVTPALGTWPLSLYRKDNDKDVPVIFMPKNREFMYVVMPINIP